MRYGWHFRFLEMATLSRIQWRKVTINNAQPIEGISGINDLQAQVLEAVFDGLYARSLGLGG
jgi:hypothetical protein